MYLPAQFSQPDVGQMQQLLQQHPLATVIRHGPDGLLADHLPLALLDQPGPWGRLQGHVARANPLWRSGVDGEAVLAVFQGPDAYISPSLYASKAQDARVVPTWNYAVVHVRGTLRSIDDPIWLAAFLQRLTDTHEASRAAPWAMADAPDAYLAKMIDQVVGLEIQIDSMVGKWKVSQNRTAADRASVAQGLRQGGSSDGQAMATLVAGAVDGLA